MGEDGVMLVIHRVIWKAHHAFSAPYDRMSARQYTMLTSPDAGRNLIPAPTPVDYSTSDVLP
jgi:hypothetical protein